MITFSIIVPTYNRSHELARCLESLFLQTYKHFEVVVCDDGSTDDTKEVVERYRNKLNLKYVWEKNWGGPARPRNQGVKIAEAEWICLLDSDDWWYPNKLEECSKYLSDYDVIYHDLDMYNSTSLVEPFGHMRSRQTEEACFKDLLINGNPLYTSSVVVKKSIMRQVSCFSENLNLVSVEDFDCWLKISKITDKFKHVPLALGGYFVGANISRSLKHTKRMSRLIDSYISELGSRKDRVRAKRMLRYCEARDYHINKYYIRALWSYLRTGPTIMINKLFNLLLNRYKRSER